MFFWSLLCCSHKTKRQTVGLTQQSLFSLRAPIGLFLSSALNSGGFTAANHPRLCFLGYETPKPLQRSSPVGLLFPCLPPECLPFIQHETSTPPTHPIMIPILISMAGILFRFMKGSFMSGVLSPALVGQSTTQPTTWKTQNTYTQTNHWSNSPYMGGNTQ